MNSPHLVSAETLARVLKAVRQFGYSPNRSAQALAGRRRGYSIGVVLPESGIERGAADGRDQGSR